MEMVLNFNDSDNINLLEDDVISSMIVTNSSSASSSILKQLEMDKEVPFNERQQREIDSLKVS